MSTFGAVIALFIGIIVAFFFKKKGADDVELLDEMSCLKDHEVAYAWIRTQSGKLCDWPYLPGHEGMKPWFFMGIRRGYFRVLRWTYFDPKNQEILLGTHTLLRLYQAEKRDPRIHPPIPEGMLRILLSLEGATDTLFRTEDSGALRTLPDTGAIRRHGLPAGQTMPPPDSVPHDDVEAQIQAALEADAATEESSTNPEDEAPAENPDATDEPTNK